MKKQKNRYYHLIILCLSLSVVSWFIMKMSKNYTQTYQIVVTFTNIPEKKVLAYQSDSLVTVTMNTRGVDLLKYEFVKKNISINYPDIITASQKNRNYITINKSQLNTYLLHHLKFPENTIIEEPLGITLELEPMK